MRPPTRAAKKKPPARWRDGGNRSGGCGRRNRIGVVRAGHTGRSHNAASGKSFQLNRVGYWSLSKGLVPFAGLVHCRCITGTLVLGVGG